MDMKEDDVEEIPSRPNGSLGFLSLLSSAIPKFIIIMLKNTFKTLELDENKTH